MAFTLPAPTFPPANYSAALVSAWQNFLGIVNNPGGLNALAALIAAIPTPPTSLFNHFTDASNSGTSITDLYSDTIPAGQLSANGQKLTAYYAGTTDNTGAVSRTWTVVFGGTTIYNTGAIGSSQQQGWYIKVEIMRDSATSVRCICTSLVGKNDGTTATPIYSIPQYNPVTGLTLSATQILKITGTSTGASNQITAKMGFVQFIP